MFLNLMRLSLSYFVGESDRGSFGGGLLLTCFLRCGCLGIFLESLWASFGWCGHDECVGEPPIFCLPIFLIYFASNMTIWRILRPRDRFHETLLEKTS